MRYHWGLPIFYHLILFFLFFLHPRVKLRTFCLINLDSSSYYTRSPWSMSCWDLYLYFFCQSALYKEDWIGLRSLNEEGKVSFISLPSDHLSISSHQMEKYIVPYINQTSDFGSEWVLNQPRQPNNGNPISWYTNGTQVLMVSKS